MISCSWRGDRTPQMWRNGKAPSSLGILGSIPSFGFESIQNYQCARRSLRIMVQKHTLFWYDHKMIASEYTRID